MNAYTRMSLAPGAWETRPTVRIRASRQDELLAQSVDVEAVIAMYLGEELGASVGEQQ